MRKAYQNLSIRLKLTLAIVSASFLVLILFSGVFIAAEIYTFRKAMVSEVSVLANIISLSATENLMLKRQTGDTQILESLKAQPHIRAAFLFDLTDTPRAQYLDNSAMEFIREAISLDFPASKAEQWRRTEGRRVSLDWSHLGMFNPVYFQNERVGTLYLLSDMKDLSSRIHALLFGFLLALGALGPFSLLLSRYLTRPIAQPLLNLFETMAAVSRNKDFSVRADKETSDEIGHLVDGFNDMLTQIEIRDSKLADHQKYLEEKVLNRTLLLQETVASLEQAKLAADSANQAKSQFLANMTHELRTPLIGVLGMNELLARTELSEQQLSLVDTVQRSGESLLALISDILDFSKIDAGFLRLDNVEVDLYKVVEEATRLLAEKAVAKNLYLTCQIMPEAMWKVRTDPSRFRQILLNLIGNALKFTESGSVAVKLDMQMSGSALGHFTLTVEDSGIGISQQEQARIFSPFVQSDNTSTRQHGGTGLGLAIVRQLVQMMDGKISLNSREGAGSTFTVELPLPLISKQLPGLPATLRGRRVLLYQQDGNTQGAIRVMLSGLGLQTVEAASPDDIWHRLQLDQRQNFPFDYAIIPMEAVLLDGSLLSEKLKNEPLLASLRIIVTGCRFPAGTDQADRSLAFLELPATWMNLTTCLVRKWQRIELVSGQDKNISTKEPVFGRVEQRPYSMQHRVLLADDNAVTRELICLSLAKHSVAIDIAGNGVEALELLESAEYDLILMDCNMPELDGIEATRRLRQRGCQIPVIALTAHVDQRVYENFASAGVNDSLRKPFRQNELFSVIEKWLKYDHGQPTATPLQLPNITEGEG